MPPITFAGVPALLLAVAIVASFFPARRASLVDPNGPARRLISSHRAVIVVDEVARHANCRFQLRRRIDLTGIYDCQDNPVTDPQLSLEPLHMFLS